MNFITIVSVLVAVLYGAEACEDDTRKQRAQALRGWGTEPLRGWGTEPLRGLWHNIRWAVFHFLERNANTDSHIKGYNKPPFFPFFFCCLGGRQDTLPLHQLIIINLLPEYAYSCPTYKQYCETHTWSDGKAVWEHCKKTCNKCDGDNSSDGGSDGSSDNSRYL